MDSATNPKERFRSGLGWFGASGLVLGPICASLFVTVLSIYSPVFADWLDPDRQVEAPPSINRPDNLNVASMGINQIKVIKGVGCDDEFNR